MGAAGQQLRGGPEDFDFLFDGGKVVVAGGERGFAVSGQGGCETVCVGEFVFSAKFGGGASQVKASFDDFDGELAQVFKDLAGDAGAMGAPGGIVHFAPINDGHRELTFACDAELDKVFDLVRAETVFEKGHDGAGVENDPLHSLRSRLRSARRIFRAERSPFREPRRLLTNSGVRGWRTRRFSSSTKAT